MPQFTDPVWTAAQTAWGEARGEGTSGMQAVLNAIDNRAKRPGWWGTGIVGVCLANEQFSCWNEGAGGERATILAVTSEDEQFRDALALAIRLVEGTLPDLTAGADSYYAVSIEAPNWVATAKFTTQIGHHRFYLT